MTTAAAAASGVGAGPLFVETPNVSGGESQDVAALTESAAVADGVSPIDDQVRTELAFGTRPEARHVLGRLGGTSTVVAYAHLTRDADGASAHLVVHPRHRRHGVGTLLLDHLLDLVGRQDRNTSPALRVWAHGDTAGAQALAAARHFTRARDLWQLRRDLASTLPDPSYPEGVLVRTFRPGSDDEAWMALNAAAFASHPEQGQLTVSDLRHRIAQPWFDPLGFFLAERDGALLGSHWTKVHPAGESVGSTPIGEVYAVGVHPAAQGLGLGKALTLTGLQHLRGAGLDAVMLYVDGDNRAAVRLYERLGFTTSYVDVMYASPT